VVASFFVVSFGHNLEVSSSQKVSLLRHGLNKRMRKNELERIKGIGPSTVRLLNSKGIKSKSDLIKYINTHTYEEWLNDFKKLRSRKSLGKKLYERFGGSSSSSKSNNGESSTTSTSNDKPEESDLNDIKGVGLKTVEVLFSKGIKSEMDLVRYVSSHTEKEFLIDFKRYRYRKKLANIFYSKSFRTERKELFYKVLFEKKNKSKEGHDELSKKQEEDRQKKNEEEQKFKDKQNGKKKNRAMNKDNFISNNDKKAFRKNWNDLAKKMKATGLVSTVIQECKSIEMVQQNELHNYCKNLKFNRDYLNSKNTQQMLGDRTRNFKRFIKYVKSKRTGEFKQRKVKRSILNLVEAVQESLKFNDPKASLKLYDACKAFYQSQTVKTTKDVVYHYRKCKFGHRSMRDSFPAGKLPGTLHTYWNNVNFLDYQSKDKTLNPNVNDPSMKCPVKEQDYNDCEAEYGTNAKECDKLMQLYVNGCKNDDVVGIWDTFKTTIISVDQEGMESVWDDPGFHDKVSKKMFRKMKFDDKLQLTFNCQKQQALCTAIMSIGNKNRAKMTFESKDGSKLIIEREEDGRVTRKCEIFKNDENKCNQYPRDCMWFHGSIERNFCIKRPIRIGGVTYKFVAGSSSSNRRRLLQSGTSGGAS
jgi:predicted flap endonuclease-1-like 5' DNA nuclease